MLGSRWMCKSVCGTRPITSLVSSSQQPKAFRAPDLSCCLEVHGALLKGEIIKMRDVCCCEPKLYEVVLARSPRNILDITGNAGLKQKHMCLPLPRNLMAFKEMNLSLWTSEGGKPASTPLQWRCLCHLLCWPVTFSMDYNTIVCPGFILQAFYCAASGLGNAFIHRWVTLRKKSLSIVTLLVLIIE